MEFVSIYAFLKAFKLLIPKHNWNPWTHLNTCGWPNCPVYTNLYLKKLYFQIFKMEEQ